MGLTALGVDLLLGLTQDAMGKAVAQARDGRPPMRRTSHRSVPMPVIMGRQGAVCSSGTTEARRARDGLGLEIGNCLAQADEHGRDR